MYTDEFLLHELKRYYIENNKVPVAENVNDDKKLPSLTAYLHHFKTWNNALHLAGLSINRVSKLTGEEYCEMCKSKKTSSNWYYKNNLKVCRKCYDSDRNYLHGITDPNSKLGMCVITEHVVSEVLNDCVKCNTIDDFHSSYDLVSKKYGTINVKSSTLCKRPGENSFYWKFSKNKNSKTPDYYICIGFSENKSEILHIWIIECSSRLVTKYAIQITNSEQCLKKVKQYEVDQTQYNDIYQNLDITTLPEFRNLNNTQRTDANGV